MSASSSLFRANAPHFAEDCRSIPQNRSQSVTAAATGNKPACDAEWQRRAFVVPAGDARRLNEEELKRLTKEDLVRLARNAELPNRSKMNKAQLARTLRRHFRQGK